MSEVSATANLVHVGEVHHLEGVLVRAGAAHHRRDLWKNKHHSIELIINTGIKIHFINLEIVTYREKKNEKDGDNKISQDCDYVFHESNSLRN